MTERNTEELDPDVRSLLDAERAPESPPAGASERVWERVRESVSAPPAGPPAGAVGSGALPVALTTLGVVAVVGAVVVGLSGDEQSHDRPPLPPQAPVEALVDPLVAPVTDLEPATVAVIPVAPTQEIAEAREPVDLEPAAPARPKRAERGRSADKAALQSSEQELLDRGRRALREGRAAVALQVAEEHRARFRRGRLVEEREALRIRSLDRLGRGDASREAARAFLKRYPSSIHRLAVERVLGSE